MAVGEGGGESAFVDKSAAGGVDQDGAALHAPDPHSVDQAGGLGCER